jgi:hypothetical protein
MIEAFMNLSAEQWLVNVLLPLGVGVLLMILAVVVPKTPFLVKTGVARVCDSWFTASLMLRRLFKTKKQKQIEAELNQKIMQWMERQKESDAERGKELVERVRRIQFSRIR